jgi:hypothetical protein
MTVKPKVRVSMTVKPLKVRVATSSLGLNKGDAFGSAVAMLSLSGRI